MRIGFASNDWAVITNPPSPGGAGWYRCALPTAGLAARGHETFHGVLAARSSPFEFVVKTWDGAIHDSLDVIIMQRYMSREAATDVGRARANGQIIVQDVDDWFWGLDPRNQAFWATHPKARPDENLDHYTTAIAASDAIIASTPYLAGRLRDHFPAQPVYVLRNMIDLDRWTPHPVRDTREALVVGWVGATSWRSGDLELLSGILGPFLARHGAKFYHGGYHQESQGAGDRLGLKGKYLARPQVPIRLYPTLFEGIDIGVAPLSSQPFNMAKSAVKLMEYAASGIPFVATATPEYEWFGVGDLARRPRDWIRALERLTDPEERRRSADRAYRRVADESVPARASEWERALRGIVAASRRKVDA